MKSIKTTFIRGLSLLLALVIVLNLPISALAAVTIIGQGSGIVRNAVFFSFVGALIWRRK